MKIFFNICLSLLLLFAASEIASAQSSYTSPTNYNGTVAVSPTNTGGASIPNPLNATSITELFQTLLDVVMVFAIPIIVFFIIYAGFLYVTARGNEHTIEQAHRALLYALIGGMLILGARVLIDVVSGTVDSVINS